MEVLKSLGPVFGALSSGPTWGDFKPATQSQQKAAAGQASSVLGGLTGAAGPGSANAGSALQPASPQQMKAAAERAAKILNPKVTDATAKFMSTEIGTAHQLLEKIKQQVGDNSTIITIDDFVNTVKALNNALKAIDTSSSDISGKHQADILKAGLSATDVLTQQSLISGTLHATAEKEVNALWAKVREKAVSQMGEGIAKLPVQNGAKTFLDEAKKISDQMQKLEDTAKNRDFLDLVPLPDGVKSHPVADSVQALTRALETRFGALGQTLESRSTSVEDTLSSLAAVRQLVIDPRFKGLSARLERPLQEVRDKLNIKFLSQLRELSGKIDAHMKKVDEPSGKIDAHTREGEISAAEKLRDRLEAIQKAPDYELTKVSQAQRSKIGVLLTKAVMEALTEVVSRQSQVIAEKQLVGKLDENDAYFRDSRSIGSMEPSTLVSTIHDKLGKLSDLESKADPDSNSRSRSGSGASSVHTGLGTMSSVSIADTIRSTTGTSLASSRATLEHLEKNAKLLVEVGELSTKITTALAPGASMSAADAKDLVAELRKFVDSGRGQRLGVPLPEMASSMPFSGVPSMRDLGDDVSLRMPPSPSPDGPHPAASASVPLGGLSGLRTTDEDSTMSEISVGHNDGVSQKTPVELKLQAMVNAEIAKVAARYQEIAALAADLQLVEDLNADTSSFQAATSPREKLDVLNATLRPDLPGAHESGVVTAARDALKTAQNGAFKEIVAHIRSTVTIADLSQPFAFGSARMIELRDAVALYGELRESPARDANQQPFNELRDAVALYGELSESPSGHANQQLFNELRDPMNSLHDHVLNSQSEFAPTGTSVEQVKALREAKAFCDAIHVDSSVIDSKLRAMVTETEQNLDKTIRKIEDLGALTRPTELAADIKSLVTQLETARATFGDGDGIDRVFSHVATRVNHALSTEDKITYDGETTEQRKISMAAGLAIVNGLAAVGRLVGKEDWPSGTMVGNVSTRLREVVQSEFSGHRDQINWTALTLENIDACEAKVQESAQILGGPHFDPNGAVGAFLEGVGASFAEAKAVEALQMAKVQVADEYVQSVMADPTQPIDYARLTRYHDVLSQIREPEIEDEIIPMGHSRDMSDTGVRTPRSVSVPNDIAAEVMEDEMLMGMSVEFTSISSSRDSALERIAQLRQPAFRQASQFAELAQKLQMPGAVGDIVSELASPQLVSPSVRLDTDMSHVSVGADSRPQEARVAFTEAFLTNDTLSTDDRIAIGAALIRSGHVEPWETMTVAGEEDSVPRQLPSVAQNLTATLVFKWSSDLATMPDPATQVQYFKDQCDEIQKLGLGEDLSTGLLSKMTEEFAHHAKLPAANAAPAAVHVVRTLMAINASHPIVYPKGSKVDAFQTGVIAAHSTALAGQFNLPGDITPRSATAAANQLAGLRVELLGNRDDVVTGLTAKVRTQCTELLRFEVHTPTVDRLENIFMVKRLMDAMPIADITAALTGTVGELVRTINADAGNPAQLTMDQLDMFAELAKMPGLPQENVNTAKAMLTVPWARDFSDRIKTAMVPDPAASLDPVPLLAEWSRFKDFAKGNGGIMECADIKALRPTIAYLTVVQTANAKRAALEAVRKMAETPVDPTSNVSKEVVQNILDVMGESELAGTISEQGRHNLRTRVELYFDGTNGQVKADIGQWNGKISDARGRGVLYGLGLTSKVDKALATVLSEATEIRDLAEKASKVFPATDGNKTNAETAIKTVHNALQKVAGRFIDQRPGNNSRIMEPFDEAVRKVDEAVAERQRTNITNRLTELRAADQFDSAAYLDVVADINAFNLTTDQAIKAQFSTTLSHAIRMMKPQTAADILQAATDVQAVRQLDDGVAGWGVGPQVDSAIKDMLKAQMKGYFEGLKISPAALFGNGAELAGIQNGVEALDRLPAIFPSLAGDADGLGISGDLGRAKAYKTTQLQVARVINPLKRAPSPQNDLMLAVALRADISDELSRPVQTLMQEIAGMSVPDGRALNLVVADRINDQRGSSGLAVQAQLLRHSAGHPVGAVSVDSFGDHLGQYLQTEGARFADMSGAQMSGSLQSLNQFLTAVGGGAHTQKLPDEVKAVVVDFVRHASARISAQAPQAEDGSWEPCRGQLDTLVSNLELTETQQFGELTLGDIQTVQGHILTGPQRQTRDAISALNRLPANSTAQQLHDSITGLVGRLNNPENFTETQKRDLKAAIAGALPKLQVVDADLQGQADTMNSLLETLNGSGESVRPDDFDALRGPILGKFVAQIRAAIIVPIPVEQWGPIERPAPALGRIPEQLGELDEAQSYIMDIQVDRAKTGAQLKGIIDSQPVVTVGDGNIDSGTVLAAGRLLETLNQHAPASIPDGTHEDTVTIGALVQHITRSADAVPGLNAAVGYMEEIALIRTRCDEIAEFEPVCARMDELVRALNVPPADNRLSDQADILQSLDHLEPKGGNQRAQDLRVADSLNDLAAQTLGAGVVTQDTLRILANLLRLAPRGAAGAPAAVEIEGLNPAICGQKLTAFVENFDSPVSQLREISDLLAQLGDRLAELPDPVKDEFKNMSDRILQGIIDEKPVIRAEAIPYLETQLAKVGMTDQLRASLAGAKLATFDMSQVDGPTTLNDQLSTTLNGLYAAASPEVAAGLRAHVVDGLKARLNSYIDALGDDGEIIPGRLQSLLVAANALPGDGDRGNFRIELLKHLNERAWDHIIFADSDATLAGLLQNARLADGVTGADIMATLARVAAKVSGENSVDTLVAKAHLLRFSLDQPITMVDSRELTVGGLVNDFDELVGAQTTLAQKHALLESLTARLGREPLVLFEHLSRTRQGVTEGLQQKANQKEALSAILTGALMDMNLAELEEAKVGALDAYEVDEHDHLPEGVKREFVAAEAIIRFREVAPTLAYLGPLLRDFAGNLEGGEVDPRLKDVLAQKLEALTIEPAPEHGAGQWLVDQVEGFSALYRDACKLDPSLNHEPSRDGDGEPRPRSVIEGSFAQKLIGQIAEYVGDEDGAVGKFADVISQFEQVPGGYLKNACIACISPLILKEIYSDIAPGEEPPAFGQQSLNKDLASVIARQRDADPIVEVSAGIGRQLAQLAKLANRDDYFGIVSKILLLTISSGVPIVDETEEDILSTETLRDAINSAIDSQHASARETFADATRDAAEGHVLQEIQLLLNILPVPHLANVFFFGGVKPLDQSLTDFTSATTRRAEPAGAGMPPAIGLGGGDDGL